MKLKSLGDLFHTNMFSRMYSSEEYFIFATCLEVFLKQVFYNKDLMSFVVK